MLLNLKRNLAVFTLLTFFLLSQNVSADVNGGVGCAACTLVLGIVEQLSVIRNTSVGEEMLNMCNLFSNGSLINIGCMEIMEPLAPLVTELFEANETADVVCHSLGSCYTDPGYPQCNIYPLPDGGIQNRVKEHEERVQEYRQQMQIGGKIDLCEIPGLDLICHSIDRFLDHHPLVDFDNDSFSTFPTMRGYDWRGRDCDDSEGTYYPGRRAIDGDMYNDSNCNGIFGINEETGIPYEDELCGDIISRGVLVLGDSASANFHIPKEWVTPSLINKEVFSYFPYIVSNELDWPMTSSLTGHRNITWPVIDGHTDSLYLRMVNRNRCNHRDYQSIAVNGARSSNMLRTQEALARDPNLDNPALLVYALIGNDVCNGREDTVGGMTTVEEMRSNALETLDFLQQTLPPDSKVLLSGLVDGRVLYEMLSQRIHPTGELRQDVTYANLYDYLVCLQVSPCTGWLNSNATLRDITSERAANLSQVLQNIAAEFTYPNFDLLYYELPIRDVIAEWEQEHGEGTGWQLIEVVDGFHPSQIGQAAFAGQMWKRIESENPDFLGDINPNNARIAEIFGDQGGH